MSTKIAKADTFQWEQTIRSALAILVRVKKDSKAAGQMLAKLSRSDSIPAPFRKTLRNWEVEVDEWKKEPEFVKPKEIAPVVKLSQAALLVERAQKHQRFPLDHSQDILFFRASEKLHDFLSQPGAKPADRARALYLAGITAEATRDMNFWTLHETYYELCIRMLPHTPRAEQCFKRLKDSVTLGYSGSGGVQIPSSVATRMETFRLLAMRQTEQTKAKSATSPAATNGTEHGRGNSEKASELHESD